MEGQQGISHHAPGQHPHATLPSEALLKPPQGQRCPHAAGRSVWAQPLPNHPRNRIRAARTAPKPGWGPSTPCLPQHDPRRVPRGVQAGFELCQSPPGSVLPPWLGTELQNLCFSPKSEGRQHPGAKRWPERHRRKAPNWNFWHPCPAPSSGGRCEDVGQRDTVPTMSPGTAGDAGGAGDSQNDPALREGADEGPGSPEPLR